LTYPILILSLFFIYNLYDLNLIVIFNFKIDFYFVFSHISLIMILFIILNFSKNFFLVERIIIYEYIILLLLFIQGSFILLKINNLFVIFIALEIQNLCSYVLAALKRYNNFSVEAGLKYFLFGSFSSSLLLFGISLIYGIFGTLELTNIYLLLKYFSYDYFYILLFIGLFFILSGLIFKLGGAPFH
jgi:NADH-quinone oxidoreductase subunit N